MTHEIQLPLPPDEPKLPPTLVPDWDGAVMWDGSGRYYTDINDAVEMIADDLWDSKTSRYQVENIPEFVICCPAEYPTVNLADYVIEHIDENYIVDDHPFSDNVTIAEQTELDALINAWIVKVGWHYLTPDYSRAVPIRELIEQHIKEMLEFEIKIDAEIEQRCKEMP